MEVAVFISCDDLLVRADREYGNGLLPGLKLSDYGTFVSLKCNESDVVCIHHGMSNLTDLDGYFLTVNADNGNVLLACSISGVGNKFFKRTSFAFGLEKLGYNCSALALEKLHK